MILRGRSKKSISLHIAPLKPEFAKMALKLLVIFDFVRKKLRKVAKKYICMNRATVIKSTVSAKNFHPRFLFRCYDKDKILLILPIMFKTKEPNANKYKHSVFKCRTQNVINLWCQLIESKVRFRWRIF